MHPLDSNISRVWLDSTYCVCQLVPWYSLLDQWWLIALMGKRDDRSFFLLRSLSDTEVPWPFTYRFSARLSQYGPWKCCIYNFLCVCLPIPWGKKLMSSCLELVECSFLVHLGIFLFHSLHGNLGLSDLFRLYCICLLLKDIYDESLLDRCIITSLWFSTQLSNLFYIVNVEGISFSCSDTVWSGPL